jgi:hypothetical protein
MEGEQLGQRPARRPAWKYSASPPTLLDGEGQVHYKGTLILEWISRKEQYASASTSSL